MHFKTNCECLLNYYAHANCVCRHGAFNSKQACYEYLQKGQHCVFWSFESVGVSKPWIKFVRKTAVQACL